MRADTAGADKNVCTHSKWLNVSGPKTLQFSKTVSFKPRLSEGLALRNTQWQCPEKRMTGFVSTGPAGSLSARCVSLSWCFAAHGHQQKTDRGKWNKDTCLKTHWHISTTTQQKELWDLVYFLFKGVRFDKIIRPLGNRRTDVFWQFNVPHFKTYTLEWGEVIRQENCVQKTSTLRRPNCARKVSLAFAAERARELGVNSI